MAAGAVGQAAFDRGLARLIGRSLARDVLGARADFRAALAAGHGEAGLFEAALAANGSGAPPDWAHALATLHAAARLAPAARAQLDLLGRMELDGQGNPVVEPDKHPLADSPRVWHAPRLLSPGECAHLAGTAADLLEPSIVVDPATGAARLHPVRTSHAATIGPTRQDVVVTALLKRVAALTATDWRCGEPVSLLRYAPGQQYRPHHDAIAGLTNQRVWTVLIYLNEGYGGGETHFPANGLRVKGRIGDAVLFRNLTPAGDPDPLAGHAGLPVSAGEKWLATRWIRARPFDPWSGQR